MSPPEYIEVPELETERLLLRPQIEEDAESIFEYAQDPRVSEFMPWDPPEKLEDTVAHLKDMERRQKEEGWVPFSIVLKESGKVIGGCNIKVDQENRSGNIGYALDPEHHGQGLGTEGAKELVRYGFEDLGLNRIEATCETENHGSAKILEKVGMEREGTLRQHTFHKGRLRDSYMYSILRSEYDSKR